MSILSLRINHLETLPPNKPLPQLPTHHPPLSQDSSTGPSDFGHTANGTILVNGTRGSSSSDILLDNINTSKEVLFRGTAPAGTCQSTEIITVGQAKLYNGPSEVGGQGGGVGRGSGHAEVLLDYVWVKQQQMKQSQPGSRQPITSQFYNGYFTQDQGRLSSLHSHLAEPRQVKVTRTKSCGPFLPGQQKQQPKDQNFSQSTILPDTKSHPMPPIPSKLPPNQNAQLEEATRSLHKALALEGKPLRKLNPLIEFAKRAIKFMCLSYVIDVVRTNHLTYFFSNGRSERLVPEKHSWFFSADPQQRKAPLRVHIWVAR